MLRRFVCTMMFILLVPAVAATQDDPLLERTKKKIEALQLQWSLDRSDAALENLLGDLADQLPGFALASRLEIAKAMSEHYRRIGQIERAEKILDGALGYHTTEEEQAQWDAAVRKLMGKGEERPSSEQDEDSLRDFILGKLDGNHLDELRALGPRALPVIERMILEDRSDMRTLVSGSQVDPLRDYILIAPERSAQFLLEQLDEQGLAFQSRILSAAHSSAIFDQRFAWALDQPPVCLLPTWLTLIERLTKRPDLFGSNDLQGLVWQLVRRDAVTPGLAANLAAVFDQGDAVLSSALVEMVRRANPVPSLGPVLLRVLGSDREQWRELAAERYLELKDVTALLAFADHPDPKVRLAVAKSLGLRTIPSLQWASSPPSQFEGSGEAVWPEWSDRELEVLNRLVKDSDEGVRAAAAASLVDAAAHQESEEVYLQILQDSSPKVRATLSKLESGVLDDTLREVVFGLSRDPSASVVQQFLDAVGAQRTGASPTPTDRWVSIYFEPVLFAAYGMGSALPEEGNFVWRPSLQDNALWKSWEARKTATRFFVENGRPNPSSMFFGSKAPIDIGILVPKEIGVESLVECLLRSEAAWGVIGRSTGESGQQAFRELFRDAQRDSRSRLAAANFLNALSSDDLELVLELFPESDWAPKDFPRFLSKAAPETRNRFILSLLENRQADPELVVAVTSQWSAHAPLGREITRAILDRWLDRFDDSSQDVRKIVTGALRNAPIMEDAYRERVLQKAINVWGLVGTAIEVYTELRDESVIPTLGRLAGGGGVGQADAIDALRAFGTDEAIAELMKALDKVTDNAMASRISGALNALWQQRQDRQKWETLKTPLPTKDSALAELLAMLDQDDPSLQIEALRGIGALGAKEAIPRLIPFLRSDNEALRKVARKVLDRLYE